jgi:hypothetical protein
VGFGLRLGRGLGSGDPGGDLAQPLDLLLQRLHAALEVGDLRAVLRDGFLEGLGFAAHFLAGDPGDFAFKDRSDVWH